MRGSLKAAIALLSRPRNKRIDWALLLGCVGIAIALWVLLAAR